MDQEQMTELASLKEVLSEGVRQGEVYEVGELTLMDVVRDLDQSS
jgi:hypothetical protein